MSDKGVLRALAVAGAATVAFRKALGSLDRYYRLHGEGNYPRLRPALEEAIAENEQVRDVLLDAANAQDSFEQLIGRLSPKANGNTLTKARLEEIKIVPMLEAYESITNRLGETLVDADRARPIFSESKVPKVVGFGIDGKVYHLWRPED